MYLDRRGFKQCLPQSFWYTLDSFKSAFDGKLLIVLSLTPPSNKGEIGEGHQKFYLLNFRSPKKHFQVALQNANQCLMRSVDWSALTIPTDLVIAEFCGREQNSWLQWGQTFHESLHLKNRHTPSVREKVGKIVMNGPCLTKISHLKFWFESSFPTK